ncbi:hypothetical protein DSBG_3403 [Desulfosporosinus sp. BG]|nr:hypothetical protein DSBG_3403 [Desulfosporosinus sp. BG]
MRPRGRSSQGKQLCHITHGNFSRDVKNVSGIDLEKMVKQLTGTTDLVGQTMRGDTKQA